MDGGLTDSSWLTRLHTQPPYDRHLYFYDSMRQL